MRRHLENSLAARPDPEAISKGIGRAARAAGAAGGSSVRPGVHLRVAFGDLGQLLGSLQLLKKGPSPTFVPETREQSRDEEQFLRIRCPLCQWQPTPASVWACESYGTPEPYFGGCGTVWNTFATHGRCPGCAHQWQWTSCPHCEQWSLHDDWYEEGS